jgi:hypothetical protein
LNGYQEDRKRNQKWTTPYSPRITVSPNFNRTIRDDNGDKQSWDSYILDGDVLNVLNLVKGKPYPGKTFAHDIEGNEDLQYYYTAPYCATARNLGYAPLKEGDGYISCEDSGKKEQGGDENDDSSGAGGSTNYYYGPY